MKKLSVLTSLISFLLFACGETTTENVTQINQMGMDVVDSEEDLPECSDENEGAQAVVKGESVVRVCIDGDWVVMDGASGAFSCKTEELKDKSGLKIVCNGDSIGVVLNGEKGESGKDGKAGKDGKDGSDGEDGKAGSGCAMTEKTDSTVTVVCGDSTIVIELGVGANGDTLELDSEKVSISLDSLAGYTQKGPFLKGSTVYLYELSDGRTLKQTNGNFTSFITRDDGRYKFTARDLASQYAMIVVEGNYRNEVTGEPSNAPIRLRALTDMRKRSSANVNLLTHLEFDRVNYLVTREHKTVKAAKKQAQAEIFNAFHIDTTGFTGSAEDLDVFGATDADAALLAISVLLQGDSNETALSVLLTEISDAIAESGKWDDSLTKARLADWALKADFAGAASRLDTFRIKVGNWHLSDTVPEYEKHVRKFFGIESRMGICGSDSVPVGFVKHVKNPHAPTYYASGYSDVSNTRVRFICKEDGGVFKWRIATDIEKDTMSLGHEFAEGLVKKGLVNANLSYVYENGNWRHGTPNDGIVNVGCIQARKDTVAKSATGNTWYKCIGDSTMNLEESSWTSAWRLANNIEKDTATWGHDYSDGDVKKGNVNTGLSYVYEEGNWRHGTNVDSYIGVGCIPARTDTVAKGSDGIWYKCKGDTTVSYYNGSLKESGWTSTWRTATNIEKDTATWGHSYSEGAVRNGRVNTTLTYVYQNNNWRLGTSIDSLIRKGCVTGRQDTVAQASNASWYICKSNSWRLATDIEKDTATWGHSYSEGAVRNGRVNTTLTYVYQNNNWRLGTSIDSLIRKGCVTGRQDTVALASNANWYICKSNSWRLATNIEKDTARWGAGSFNGEVRAGNINKSIYYRYVSSSKTWREATTIEKDTYDYSRNRIWPAGNDGQIQEGSITNAIYVYDATSWRVADEVEKTLGGCVSSIKDSVGKATDNIYYICSPRMWVKATAKQYDTYKKKCSTFGQIIHGNVNTDSVYFCYGTQWEHFYGNENAQYIKLVDARDNHIYRTVKIGNQTWMAENLNFEYKVKPQNGSDSVTFGFSCKFGGGCNSDSTKMLGRFYSWPAAMDSAAVFSNDGAGCGEDTTCVKNLPVRGICPVGWHLPSGDEWKTLISVLGSDAGSKLKSAIGWKDNKLGESGGGTDDYGFTAFPAYRGDYNNGYRQYAVFHSSSGGGKSYVDGFILSYDKSSAYVSYYAIYNQWFYNSSKMPIRCLKN